MDDSMSNRGFSGSGRMSYTPRTRQSSASSIMSGRKSLHGINAGAKKWSTSGRYSVSGRSNQSLQIIARSEYNTVESYGLPLPVLVNEALTFSERNTIVSINCSVNGWAWAVCGRRLLVWQYKDSKLGSPKMGEFIRTPQRRATSAQCRELTLPHCDIGHKATLICVFIPEEQQMASCLAVSPTGDIRYWPSIAHDGSSIDSTGILEGQELDYLFNISPQGYVLVTTTCSLVLLQLQLQNGRHAIQHKTIKPPSGFFGGIGKKFASIIIGMNSGQDKENKFVKIVGEPIPNTNNWTITVLADTWLQRWLFTNNGIEQFIFEDHEIFRKIREEFQQKFWSGRENNDIEVTLLDMQISESSIYLLSGAVNNAHTPQMYYAIVNLKTENDALKINSFIPLKITLFYSPGTENECLKMRFIINRGLSYLYTEKTIYPINLTCPADVEVEKIEFNSQNDKIMQGTVCGNIPLFFTRAHGLVSVSPSDFDQNDFLNSSYSPDVFGVQYLGDNFNQTIQSNPNTTAVGNLTMYDLDPDEIYNTDKDQISQLKAAFIYHLKRNTSMCNSILGELFPNKDNLENVDSLLDKLVVSIAQNLAEDIPAADPRWENQECLSQNRNSLGSSASLQIITQLREKNSALNHFIDFLHTTELWSLLGAVSYKGSIKSTCHILSDINEKIIAAIALKKAQNTHMKLIDQAIQNVLVEWNEEPTGNLVSQDLFYVKLTKFQDIFHAFQHIADKCIEDKHQTQLAECLSQLNSIILLMLNDVLQFREHKSGIYSLPVTKLFSYEYLPWTASSGKNGIREPIMHFIDITLKYGARSTGEPEIKQLLYQQLVELIDFLLNGRKCYLESVKDHEKYGVLLQQYESQRRDLIFPLIEDLQYELAAKLAEKYLDFQCLVIICDKTENQERLNSYIERYEENEFSQFAINWHLRQNKQGDLFERFKGNQVALSQFLGNHPSLAWIQLVFNGDFNRASNILLQLAQDETEYVTRKKTILSLAKLSCLAVDLDMSTQVADINLELNLIEYQEQLPIQLLESFGYDTNNQRVLKAEEIINLFVSDENETATEFDFRKALEILNFVDDPFDTRHKIWCAAILRDSWKNYNMNSPLDQMQEMMFFKLIDLCYLMDGDLEEFLPPQEDFLRSNDLGDLVSDKSFQYLLKLGYEHISNDYRKQDIIEQQ